MRLIDVHAFIQLDKHGKTHDPGSEVLVNVKGDQLRKTKYAILSHCWSYPNSEEIEFEEMQKITDMKKDVLDKSGVRKRTGYEKILRTCLRAREDELKMVWVDTCCINKASSAELSEAINSMFRWYSESERCYAYLHDVSGGFPTTCNKEAFPESNGWPRWFSRGWTLQELVAPRKVQFFDKAWIEIGNKHKLADALSKITRIPIRVLEDGLPAEPPSVAQIMSWAADRRTMQDEDRAYSLLGLLGVNMPMVYGEGKNAFQRLQLEIIRKSNDQTIFAWGHSRKSGCSSSFLAGDPSDFGDCSDVVRVEPREFIDELRNNIPENELVKIPEDRLREVADSIRLRKFSVTNAGIHITLPVTPCRGSSWLSEASLACRDKSKSRIVTIVLGCSECHFSRYFGDFGTPLYVKLEFRKLLLPYQELQRTFTFHLDFSRRLFPQPAIFPSDVTSTDSAVTLSSTNDCAIIFYAHHDHSICFSVVLHFHFDRHSVDIICDEFPGSWEDYIQQVYQHVRRRGLEQSRHISDVSRSISAWPVPLVNHYYFPRSDIPNIHGVWMVYKLLDDNCRIQLGYLKNAGCHVFDWQIVGVFLFCKVNTRSHFGITLVWHFKPNFDGAA